MLTSSVRWAGLDWAGQARLTGPGDGSPAAEEAGLASTYTNTIASLLSRTVTSGPTEPWKPRTGRGTRQRLARRSLRRPACGGVAAAPIHRPQGIPPAPHLVRVPTSKVVVRVSNIVPCLPEKSSWMEMDLQGSHYLNYVRVCG